ncbi:hypothetical protein [Pseudomonas sp. DWP3-1-2]|uniref:hypothetical protein n=1 Tax=Pseudomonas sp. DWP3-1-2 TaxID=2804645 RepID=UPI003CF47DAF
MNNLKSDSTHFNAVISGNHLISFPELSETQRQDVIDLMMYADFYASQTWRREEQWTSWMQYYQKQLLASGCQLVSNIVKEPIYITDASELDHIGFGVTGTARVGKLLELAQRSFKAARVSHYARHFFEFGSAAGSLSAFQVVPCEPVDGDTVRILICGLNASATVVSDDRGGDWRVNREMVIRLSGGIYSLSQKDYTAHRDRIRTRLLQVSRYNLRGVNI